ncbi:MAG: hypothetical protein ABR990_12565 [Terracidiphilus sp.]
MKPLTRDPVCNLSRIRTAAVVAFFVLNLAVYLVRILSVWRYGALFCSTAVESPMIDSVWRCMNHRPVYLWPFAFPFSLSLYNYLFYYVYAGVLRLIGAWDAGILTWGRQLTLLFALLGAIAQWRLVRALLYLRGLASTLSLCLSLGLWLCTSLVKYWALSIRPDMAAAALVMIALWVVVRQPHPRPQPQLRFCFAWAGLLLYLAWAFKQSMVLAFAGLCLWLLLNKRWRDLTLLVATFAALVAATLLLGTPEYRFSILIAPQMVRGFAFSLPWILRALGTGLTAVGLNLYWVAAPFVLLCPTVGAWKTKPEKGKSHPESALYQGATFQSAGKLKTESALYHGKNLHLAEKFIRSCKKRQGTTLVVPQKQQNNSWALAPEEISPLREGLVRRFNSPLFTVFALALLIGLAGMGKIGGTSNYLFEAFAAGSTLLQLAVFSMPGRLVTALLLFGCIQPAVQLAGVAIGYHHPGKKDMVPIATASEYRDAVALRNRLVNMKKPIFTTDGIFSLPWNSAENDAPAIVIDPNFQQAARTHEQSGGVEGILQRGEIPTVMLASTDLVYLNCLHPNYRKVGESLQQGVTYIIYEFSANPPH